MMMSDDMYMHRCLQLAKQGVGSVSPNPMVGAVLVHNSKIIGEGYHKKFGEPHAEVNCIADAENKLSDLSDESKEQIFSESTLYVSLEPCAHFGKTPPCADLVVQKKIGRVVVASRDPFDKVNGNGIEKLKSEGIIVNVGTLVSKSNYLNRRFFTFHIHQRPYIILKWAQSSDGFISKTGIKNLPVSNALTNKLVHKWRSEESSIMVGRNTAAEDDPSLTTRLWPGNSPARIVIDRHGNLAAELKIFDGHIRTFVFNNIKEEQRGNIFFLKVEDGPHILNQIANRLYILQVQSVIVEGGSILLKSFIDAGLWDEARVITNENLLIEDGTKSPLLRHAVLKNEFNILFDRICFYDNELIKIL